MDDRVALVYMPFGGADRPPVGIANLKAGLKHRGIASDVLYLNFILAEWVGPEFYQDMSNRTSHMVFAGEWVFAHEFFGRDIDGDGYIEHLRKERRVDQPTIRSILQLRTFARPFLDYCRFAIDWSQYSIIGFSTTFEQNTASLALAHAIKSRYPQKRIVFGGANCEGDLGLGLHRHFPYLDFVFTGQADQSFPRFIERMIEGKDFRDIPGIVYRQNGESRSTGSATSITNMNELPIPDYDEYFAQLATTSIPKRLHIRLQFESSRGCWWGMKHHCTFCGFNAQSMAFHSKSKDRVLAELEHLTRRYGVEEVDAVDNIMDMAYFREVLPELKKRKLNLGLFYEMKTNLTKEQVFLLRDAGVRNIQPGIESLNAHVLLLMKKGVSPLQNIQVLKWCLEAGIHPNWNLLYGFPGEKPEDYIAMLNIMRSLSHLTPPGGSGRIRMDRFSPYQMRPQEYGLVDIRPLAVYRYIYPLSDESLAKVAYFFDYKRTDPIEPESYIGPTLEWIDIWRRVHAMGARLNITQERKDEIVIDDSRIVTPARRITLKGWQSLAYQHCERSRSLSSILKVCQDGTLDSKAGQHEVEDFLSWAVAEQLMVCEQDHYLSLAVKNTGAEIHGNENMHSSQLSH